MNLTIDINNKTEIRNAITLLESLIENPNPAATFVTQPALPTDTPEPPEGFVYAGMGPLKNQSKYISLDILRFDDGFGWNNNEGNGWRGSVYGPWAVRIGSEIAKANGL